MNISYHRIIITLDSMVMYRTNTMILAFIPQRTIYKQNVKSF